MIHHFGLFMSFGSRLAKRNTELVQPIGDFTLLGKKRRAGVWCGLSTKPDVVSGRLAIQMQLICPVHFTTPSSCPNWGQSYAMLQEVHCGECCLHSTCHLLLCILFLGFLEFSVLEYCQSVVSIKVNVFYSLSPQKYVNSKRCLLVYLLFLIFMIEKISYHGITR